MSVLVNEPGIAVKVCDAHGVVHVTIGGTTLHLRPVDFERVVSALEDAAAALRLSAMQPAQSQGPLH